MITRVAALCLLSALLLAGCATKNDAGITLHKKPDLTKVTPGTPVSKVASLKQPIKREVITKGEMKGAEAWLYEWDAPGDEVNNKMFTSVVVKDGVILGYAEDTPDKWRKDPKLHEAAKLASSWEDIGGHMAQAARWQAAADALAGYNAQRVAQPRFDPVQAGAAMFANSYKPWENAQPVNYGMFGSGTTSQPIITTTRLANMYGTRGELVGSVNRRGQLLDARGELAGSIRPNGQILDARGDLAGQVQESGNILDSRGRYSGKIQ